MKHLITLILIFSTLGLTGQVSTKSCHHTLYPQVEEEFYTKEQLAIEAAFAITPVGWIGKVGGLVLKPVIVKVGSELALDATQIVKTFAVKGIVKTMSHPKLGKIVLQEGGKGAGWQHILQRHVKYFATHPQIYRGTKGELFTQNPQQILELMEKTLKFGTVKNSVRMKGVKIVTYKNYELVIQPNNTIKTFYPLK